VAFYQASVGVVASAEVATAPEDNAMPGIVKDPTKYRWTFKLADTRLFLDQPRIIDADMRSKLDAFAEKDQACPGAGPSRSHQTPVSLRSGPVSPLACGTSRATGRWDAVPRTPLATGSPPPLRWTDHAGADPWTQ
jgi:hypothetical protein